MVTDGQERRDAILRHIARYGLTVRPVLERLFYHGHEKSLDRDLDRMRESGWISITSNAIAEPTEPQTRYSYYQLATAGARRIAAAKSRTRALGGEALSRNLALLWFCCMSSQRRHRLDDQDLVDLFGHANVFAETSHSKEELRLRGFHCLDREGDRFRVLNLYAPRTTVGDVVVELRKRIRDLRTISLIAEATDAHKYGFAILAESTQLRDQLREELAKSFAPDGIMFHVTQSPRSWKPQR